MTTACFFAHGHDAATFDRVEFYRRDIEILRGMGLEVRLATRWREIPAADLYFAWWWTWAFQPALVSLLRRRPLVITGTFDLRSWGLGFGDYHSRPSHQRALMRWAARRASANVFLSEMEYDDVGREFGLRNCHYVPCGVDCDLYAVGPADRDNFVLTVAWLHGPNAERKCVPEIVRAIPAIRALHPEVRFVIVGERRSGYDRLAGLVAELGLGDAVEFPGAVSRERKIELMQRCRVYLQPSRHEGFGLATLEAMSCGAPVVSSPVGAVPEVLGEAGVMVDGTSPPAIAAGVVGLLGDERRRREMGCLGRRRAETMFPLERRRRELAAVVERALDGAGR